MKDASSATERQHLVCIHGHFYQPPRENPWLEYLEQQDSAYPFHDWNDRINAECYGPNSASRILDPAGRIERIVNNYSRISFNFGPTLLSWMEKQAPEVYAAILEADRVSVGLYSGHGCAMAQAYNHMIMPLATRRDKTTQVVWGIRDFRARFGREPEGMWLPETAVDVESLEVLAEQGIRFTILQPHQAGRVRKIGTRAWKEVEGNQIDTTMPYAARLPSGRTIDLFFYDGPVARAVAFEGLLNDGVHFAERVLTLHSKDHTAPQLAHIANDGETYGHHHRRGDMALSYALHWIELNKRARVTNYGEFLDLHPPTHEVEIVENTSWSCAHGIERWRSDCGCKAGGYPSWTQAWRRPLRESLDWLRDELSAIFERHGGPLFKDLWAARDAYIDVVLDRCPETVFRFMREHAKAGANNTEVLKLLEMQRHAMLMYTSCAWFFDEISGIEPVQILRYAGRAMQLATEVSGADIEPGFLARLGEAKSNIPEYGNGRQLYEMIVRPSVVDLGKVAAHYAVRSLFDAEGRDDRVYCYRIERLDYQKLEAGRAQLAVGSVRVYSEITWETSHLCFAILHFGDHTLNGGVRLYPGDAAYQAMLEEVKVTFRRADLAETVRVLDRHFAKLSYSLSTLFRDEQRQIINLILAPTVSAAEEAYRQLYSQHAPLMRFLNQLKLAVPRAIQVAGEFVLNSRLGQELEAEELDLESIYRVLDEVKETAVLLDGKSLGFVLSRNLERGLKNLTTRPSDLAVLQNLTDAVALGCTLPFEVDLSSSQNIYWQLLQRIFPALAEKARTGDAHAARWVERFTALGEVLRIRVPTGAALRSA